MYALANGQEDGESCIPILYDHASHVHIEVRRLDMSLGIDL